MLICARSMTFIGGGRACMYVSCGLECVGRGSLTALRLSHMQRVQVLPIRDE